MTDCTEKASEQPMTYMIRVTRLIPGETPASAANAGVSARVGEQMLADDGQRSSLVHG